ncbi:uncharacterized protein LOC124436490 [Xenia sp. Carnegie-2017]|uniref:uncharacterized protein LOC124436490 n=1 Tax=Xenia sp. Carnegie-2017 TaxID=2897299 RepID=UPI001F03D594|nr:uncharacterized protein LOC124436490 [Xenia sp. Carnegie-2017]
MQTPRKTHPLSVVAQHLTDLTQNQHMVLNQQIKMIVALIWKLGVVDRMDVLNTVSASKKKRCKQIGSELDMFETKKFKNKGNVKGRRRRNDCLRKQKKKSKKGNKYYHMVCLKLKVVPDTDPWFCPSCRGTNSK